MPAGWEDFHLPIGLHQRLQELLDRQDAGQFLTENEFHKAQSLVDLAEWLSLLQLKAKRKEK